MSDYLRASTGEGSACTEGGSAIVKTVAGKLVPQLPSRARYFTLNCTYHAGLACAYTDDDGISVNAAGGLAFASTGGEGILVSLAVTSRW